MATLFLGGEVNLELYVDYNYYTDTYKGAEISEVDFEKKMFNAEIYLNNRIRGKLRMIDNEEHIYILKRTLCQLVEVDLEHSSTKNIASKSLGDSSVTYSSTSQVDFENYKFSLVTENLKHTGLILFAGKFVRGGFLW